MSQWHGFIPMAYDTKIMSSYVNENFSNGLKQNSKAILGYEQKSYKETTTFTGIPEDLPRGGKLLSTETNEDGNKVETREYRMNELTAEQVFDYGTDDTVCTAALFNHYRMVMEIEKTFHVMEEVEIGAAYLCAKGYVDGCKVSIETLRKHEKEDDETYEAARHKVQTILLEHGIIDRLYEPYTDCRCADFKAAFAELYGYEIESKVRTHAKLADQMRSDPNLNGNDIYMQFASAVERQDMEWVNQLLIDKYRSNPVIDMNSPKVMTKFLYDILELPVRVVNKPTALERKEQREMAQAVYKYTKLAMEGKDQDPNAMTPEERAHVRSKAKANEVAVNLAMLYDATGWKKELLESMVEMKKVITRRSFYYTKYPYKKHWKDGLIHSSMNQCAAATRRYSSSDPNLQQLPKKGEGVKIREMVVPHHRKAVIVSLDFSGQELRLGADYSRDKNFLDCYIGDNKKDPHSITAAGAMVKKWGFAELKRIEGLIASKGLAAHDEYELFVATHKKLKDDVLHKKADDLRKKAKNVNFGAQYDAQALTLSYQLLMPVNEAQEFLDAREKMFPGVSVWKDKVRHDVINKGYATTKMGARRHLAKLMMNKETANKAGRQGPNFCIQGSAAEQTKLAMGRVWESNVCYDYDCRFIAPIHDELVFSIHVDHVVEAVKIIYDCMVAQYADMIVPSASSISVGKNFGEQLECEGPNGEDYHEETIRKMLAKIFNKEEEVAA